MRGKKTTLWPDAVQAVLDVATGLRATALAHFNAGRYYLSDAYALAAERVSREAGRLTTTELPKLPAKYTDPLTYPVTFPHTPPFEN